MIPRATSLTKLTELTKPPGEDKTAHKLPRNEQATHYRECM